MHRTDPLVGLVEVGLPMSLGAALVAFGLWYRDRPVGRKRALGLFTWTVLGGVLFVALVSWLLYIAWLGGTSTGDAGYLLLNAAAVGATGNAVSGALYIQFVLERERLGETAAALRERNDRLDRFASMVSHDLRNPLAIARGRAELAYEEPESTKHHLEPALDALARIDDRLGDLLALARDGTVDDTSAVSLREAAEAAWESVETDGAALEVDDATVPSSERLLVQALENLFDNAVTHGGRDVTVSVTPLPDGGFRVADDGDGIPPAERERILQPGVSGRENPTEHGEGLAIVGNIAEAHGWELRVGESVAGGAAFEFRPEEVESVPEPMAVSG
jgi:signal transduction histidine kinase